MCSRTSFIFIYTIFYAFAVFFLGIVDAAADVIIVLVAVVRVLFW